MSRVNFPSSTNKMTIGAKKGSNLTLPTGDRCYSFGGTDEYVRADGPTSLIDFNNKPHSISTWFKVSAFTSPAYQALWAFTNTSDANVRYWLSCSSNGTITIFGWKAGSGRLWGSGSGLAVSSSGKDDGAWHHILVTYNGSNGLAAYFDGGAPTGIAVGAGTLIPDKASFGARLVTSSPGYLMIGKLAQLAIYDYQLNATQAAIVYNSGKTFNERELSPSHYYIFGDGPDYKTFPTLNDLGRGGGDGTATNMEAADIVTDHP